MTILAVAIFGGTLVAAIWSMIATIMPHRAQIADLLRYGAPVVTKLPAPVAARGSLRKVTVRRMASSAPLRAVA